VQQAASNKQHVNMQHAKCNKHRRATSNMQQAPTCNRQRAACLRYEVDLWDDRHNPAVAALCKDHIHAEEVVASRARRAVHVRIAAEAEHAECGRAKPVQTWQG
jgi:hypothetical protein